MDQIATLFTFLTVFFLIICAACLISMFRNPVDTQLREVQNLYQKKKKNDAGYIHPEKSNNFFVYLGKKFAPTEERKISITRKWLLKAGLYSNYFYFYYWGIKILFAASFPVGLYFYFQMFQIPISDKLFVFFLVGLVGFFLFDFFIFLKIKGRQEKIFCGLPDTLDLMVVCIESGLGFDSTLKRVCEEIQLSNVVLHQELLIASNSLRLAMSKEAVLHDLGERTGVQDLKSLAAVIIQSEKFGTNLADALRVHADDMRTRRRQRAEELAQKTTIKLLFPLILFILPCLFVVIAGPAVIRIYEVMIKGNF